MQYKIQAIMREDEPGAALALVEAFMADPLFDFLIPNDRERRRWLPHLMPELLKQSRRGGMSRVAVDSNGCVVGALAAGPYPPRPLEGIRMMLRTTLLPWPWEPSMRHMRHVFTYMKIWDAMHERGDHAYVYIIGVHPDHQGRGLGKHLMTTLFPANPQRPVYLETQTASNVPFYESLGFAITGEHHPFDDGPGTWGMIRHPA